MSYLMTELRSFKSQQLTFVLKSNTLGSEGNGQSTEANNGSRGWLEPGREKRPRRATALGPGSWTSIESLLS